MIPNEIEKNDLIICLNMGRPLVLQLDGVDQYLIVF